MHGVIVIGVQSGGGIPTAKEINATMYKFDVSGDGSDRNNRERRLAEDGLS